MAETQLDYSALDNQLAGMLDAPRWYVGLSGGVDSTVLLHLLQRWRQAHEGAPGLSAIHVNHGLQASAGAWQEHCRQLCNLLQVPILCLSADVQRAGTGPEAAAREARYRVFEEQLQPNDVLFLGHHLDDQVETFFLRLMRGAGVQGLAAMPHTRALGQGRLVRPLLHVTRGMIEDYARRHTLEYVEDPSNDDTALDRNFLRAQLLPRLASRWPGYRQTVARASEHLAVAAGALAESLPAPPTVFSTMGDPGIALDELVGPNPQLGAIKLRHWLQSGGFLAPGTARVEEFLRQLCSAEGDANPRLQSRAFTLQRYRDAVYLLPDPAVPDEDKPVLLASGASIDMPGVGRLGLQRVASDGLLLKPDEVLEVAWRKGGERCTPRGRAGSNSLKKLLQEWAVPPWWRDRVPLLYLQEEMLAVADLCLCDSSRWRSSAPAGQQLWRPVWQREAACAAELTAPSPV